MSATDEKPRAPPRRTAYDRSKTTQDNTSALFLNMIRALITSTSEDQRELDRRRLERGFAEYSKTVDALVREHENDVEVCLESFRTVSSKITACRERMHSLKSGLLSCRSLLQCRRDDLKRLWMENAQQKHVSHVLDQIEKVKHLESEVNEAIQHADYLSAANSLKEADLLLNGPFSNIDGLSNLRTDIHEVSKKLVEHILNDIVNYLVVNPFESRLLEVIKSFPESKAAESKECSELLKKSMVGKANMTQPSDLQPSQVLIGEHMNMCLRSLAVFDRLSSTLMQVRHLIPSTLAQMIQKTALIIRVAFREDESGDVRYLAQYIQLVIAQLKSSYEVHCILEKELEKFKRAEKDKKNSDTADNINLSIVSGFWETAQEALQKIVSDYVKEVDLPMDTVQKTSNNHEKVKLFKFSASACTASGLSSSGSNQQLLICPPSPWNITAIFPYLEKFCSEREAESGLRQPCSLRKFLHSFVLDVFVDRFRTKMERLAENALQGRDAWRNLLSPPNPISCLNVILFLLLVLSSCYNIFGICEEIGKLIVTMETFTDRLSSLWLLVIQDFLKIASSVYEMIIRPSFEKEEKRERRKISAAWAVDEDISRLLKSLPNWCLAVSDEEIYSSLTTPTSILAAGESESEIRQRNERESELLIGNLGTAKQLVKEELITDMELIHSLACMHESLKWFCKNFRNLIDLLSESAKNIMRTCVIQYQSQTEATEHKEENIYDAVEGRLAELDTIADTCLLIIHLELRVHCFFHLLPLARVRPSLPHDELDNEMVSFGRDMMQFHQLLNGYLPIQKMKYLFDGLGHLAASIFIHSSQHIQKLTENGRKRVCRSIFAVQKRLSKLTGRRESDLDRARSFYELLSHDPDELLAIIIEQGACYSHLEYTYLISLAIRSNPALSAQPGALEQRITQLKSILSQLKKQ
uniref:Exocyst complex component Sec8 n=1 Tax=Syphacia muris TaxID=451379 RepID=A0A0N5AMY7_9BILA